MKNGLHTFHIPVMGTGYSVDTPIRVSHFGISSVISVVDDFLLEKVREHYNKKYGLPYERIAGTADDARAKRTAAWLDTVGTIAGIEMERVRNLPFFEDNDKKKYFDLLPETSPLKIEYAKFTGMKAGSERDAAGEALTRKMLPGSIDINIMVKLDKTNYDEDGSPLGNEFSDAKASLRGFANSMLESSVVFSAGINKKLFTYMSRFRDFYRDESGKIRKKIILKVSDFRSAMIQGRFLAKKGLEICEYRIESGLNCGGHAFATDGYLLPPLLQEFKENREHLATGFRESVKKYYSDRGWKYTAPESEGPLVTVQGGIGTHGETLRLAEDFGMDMTGWASPFLLVPEASCVDEETRKLLEQSGKNELYLSGVSPLGVRFNNLRYSGSYNWTKKMAESGKPGSPCPKRLLVSNTEFTEKPICLSSSEYQRKKLARINEMDIPKSEKESLRKEITEKGCLCGHLANSALISLGMASKKNSPQLVCPGPNIEWFNREYTLREMADHIYGRGPSLVSEHRPHMFANEMRMYVDYFENLVKKFKGTDKEIKAIREFKSNLTDGMAFCSKIAEKKPYPGENLDSLKNDVEKESRRLKSIYAGFERKLKLKEMIGEGMSSSLSPSVAC